MKETVKRMAQPPSDPGTDDGRSDRFPAGEVPGTHAGQMAGIALQVHNFSSVGPWNDFILSEWELEPCAWEDFHPHTETTFVLEGELHIQSEGETVILKPGDSARVNPGRAGRYRAPVYARMVTIYGPNPEGLGSHSFKYAEL
ncbi:MAG: cupin domain-containing protein [Pseudarthrobacter sp.]